MKKRLDIYLDWFYHLVTKLSYPMNNFPLKTITTKHTCLIMFSFMKNRKSRVYTFKGEHGLVSDYGVMAILFKDETGDSFFSTMCF